MGENKGQTIFLSVIGIATLLVAIIGATFAYFTTTISGDPATASVSTATISQVVFAGAGVEGMTNVLPGYVSGEKQFSVTITSLTGTGAQLDYTCKISQSASSGTTGIADLQFSVTGADNDTYGTWQNVTSTGVQIASGTLKSDKAAGGATQEPNYSDVFKYKLRFKETGEEQDAQQGHSTTVSISCALADSTVYFNNEHPGGTTSEPAAID